MVSGYGGLLCSFVGILHRVWRPISDSGSLTYVLAWCLAVELRASVSIYIALHPKKLFQDSNLQLPFIMDGSTILQSGWANRPLAHFENTY